VKRSLAQLLAFLLFLGHGAARDNDELRSKAQRAAFMRAHPCPANAARRGACPGYVVDHIIPLHCGGADDPSNMQWQTISAAVAKDRLEHDCSNFIAH
jgi:hypothetical protein